MEISDVGPAIPNTNQESSPIKEIEKINDDY
jgi:hypothetical protein